MPGKTPYEAVDNYRTPIVRAIRVLSSTAHLIPGRTSRNYQVNAPGYWRLGDAEGLELKTGDRSRLVFKAEQAYKIVRSDPAKHDITLGEYRVTTTMYAYELTVDGKLAWQMHWHPDASGDEYRPHYHLPGKDHLPSARHTVEDAVEWCLHYGAVPDSVDWSAQLAESKGVHELYRSWSSAPDEPRG